MPEDTAFYIHARLRTLAAASPLWQLRISCLHYCRFVHSHHHAESVLLFPELRRSNPALNPVVDKLQADHEPRRWPDTRYSSNTWGPLPPRSYFRFDEDAVASERESLEMLGVPLS